MNKTNKLHELKTPEAVIIAAKTNTHMLIKSKRLDSLCKNIFYQIGCKNGSVEGY